MGVEDHRHAAVFERLPPRFKTKAEEEAFHLPQTINPGPVHGPLQWARSKAAVSESPPTSLECFLDTRRECFLHLWELILAAILFVVLVRVLD